MLHKLYIDAHIIHIYYLMGSEPLAVDHVYLIYMIHQQLVVRDLASKQATGEESSNNRGGRRARTLILMMSQLILLKLS